MLSLARFGTPAPKSAGDLPLPATTKEAPMRSPASPRNVIVT